MKKSVEPHSQTKTDLRSNSGSLIPCHMHHNWCCSKVTARTESLFRGSGSPLCGLGSEDREPMHPHPMAHLGELHRKRKKWPQTNTHCHGSQTIQTKGPVIMRKHTNLRPPLLHPFQSQGIFVLSGNGIVFSGKNELIKDAVCANNDNLRRSKITSLPRRQTL